MTLDEQAEYADYVVSHICELDLEIVKDFVLEQKMTKIPEQLTNVREFDSSVIGGKAKIALLLQDEFPEIADQLKASISAIKKLYLSTKETT